jgi:type IV pilus assembly protein PilN
MRIDINLASQPYEDARQFWMRWGAALGILSVLTLVLLGLLATGWMAASKDRAAMSQKRALIADRERLEAQAQKTLNLPENRTMWSESQYLNTLIERKAFSWTRVLENMEKVMPPRVHLVSISPQLNDDNQLELKMTVAGDSRDRGVELLHRMEQSRRFGQVAIQNERHVESQTGDTEQIELAAVYIPELTPDAASGAPSGARTKTVPVAKPKATGAKKGGKH